MLAGGMPEPTLDMVRRRKRRVHHDDRGRDRPIQPVIDRGGIVIRDDGTREQLSQQRAAGLREFIQRQVRARNPGEDRQKAVASGWLEHQIFDPKPCRLPNNGRERKRVENCCRRTLSSERRV